MCQWNKHQLEHRRILQTSSSVHTSTIAVSVSVSKLQRYLQVLRKNYLWTSRSFQMSLIPKKNYIYSVPCYLADFKTSRELWSPLSKTVPGKYNSWVSGMANCHHCQWYENFPKSFKNTCFSLLGKHHFICASVEANNFHEKHISNSKNESKYISPFIMDNNLSFNNLHKEHINTASICQKYASM